MSHINISSFHDDMIQMIEDESDFIFDYFTSMIFSILETILSKSFWTC